jgi:hypothetical protein
MLVQYLLVLIAMTLQPSADYGLLRPATACYGLLWPAMACYGLLWPAMASSFTRFLDHIQRRATVSRTPLDE